MKRAVAVIICVLAAASLLLTACASSQDLSNSKYLGTWKAVSISVLDEKESADDAFGGEYIMELKADGTGTFTGMEENEQTTFNWKETDDGIKTSGDMKLKFTDDNGTLKTKIIGAELAFEKQ